MRFTHARKILVGVALGTLTTASSCGDDEQPEHARLVVVEFGQHCDRLTDQVAAVAGAMARAGRSFELYRVTSTMAGATQVELPGQTRTANNRDAAAVENDAIATALENAVRGAVCTPGLPATRLDVGELFSGIARRANDDGGGPVADVVVFTNGFHLTDTEDIREASPAFPAANPLKGLRITVVGAGEFPDVANLDPGFATDTSEFAEAACAAVAEACRFVSAASAITSAASIAAADDDDDAWSDEGVPR